jgi:DNA-binding transcriptional ArsR family regulator
LTYGWEEYTAVHSRSGHMGFKGFTQVENAIFNYYQLPGFTIRHYGLYCVLKSYLFTNNREITVFPSRASLSERTGMGHSTISRHLRDLEQFGLIEVVRKNGVVNHYKIYKPLAENEFKNRFKHLL